MYATFQQNKAKLIELICKMGSFKTKTLLKRFFKERRGDVLISGKQTIVEFLDELHEQGKLRYEGGYYSVVRASGSI
jgi:hypothetical protein